MIGLKRRLVTLEEKFKVYVAYGREETEQAHIVTFYPDLPNRVVSRHTFDIKNGIITECEHNQERQLLNYVQPKTDDEIFEHISSYIGYYVYPLDFWYSNGYIPQEYKPYHVDENGQIVEVQ